MALSPGAEGEIRHSALHPARLDHYPPHPTLNSDGEDVRQPAISEGDLRGRIEAGGAVQGCLVLIERNQRRGTTEFVPYFRTTWDDQALGLALYRQRGLRGWSDFRKLLDFLRGIGFAGPTVVVEEADPLVAEWRIEPAQPE